MKQHNAILFAAAISALVTIAAPGISRAQADSSRASLSTISAEEIEALLRGSGSGAGRAAEVNGYPGPNRLVKYAIELGLSADQLDKVKRLNQEMKREAMDLGRRIVEGETKLDMLLKSGSVDRSRLSSLVSEIGGLRGRLRLVHLQLHFALRALLTDDQLLRYRALSAADEGKK